MATCPHLFERYTFRGQCAECAPDLHRAHEAANAAVSFACQQFERETGLKTLGNWDTFESWLESSVVGQAVARALLRVDEFPR